jgi:threonine aldolase
LGCFPKEITWKLGVDVLSFGGTKNGLAAGELVIFFDKARGREFEYRAKQAGQLASKMRFLAAPWHALLQDEVWLRNARHANVAAKRFAKALLEEVQLEIAFPVEANALFVRMRQEQYEELRGKGWRFSQFFETDLYRLMCSWSTTNEKIDRFVNDARALRSA